MELDGNPRIVFSAARELSAGEELYYDYGDRRQGPAAQSYCAIQYSLKPKALNPFKNVKSRVCRASRFDPQFFPTAQGAFLSESVTYFRLYD